VKTNLTQRRIKARKASACGLCKPWKKQWEKFKAHPNLIYTDGNEWALYRSGKPWPEDNPAFVQFSGDITTDGKGAISDGEAQKLHELLIAFFNWQPIVPRNAPQLAEMLAPLCRLARADVLRAIPKWFWKKQWREADTQLFQN